MRLMGAPMAAQRGAAVHNIVAAARAGRGSLDDHRQPRPLRRYHRQPAQRGLIDEADMVVADGMPLVWASSSPANRCPNASSGRAWCGRSARSPAPTACPCSCSAVTPASPNAPRGLQGALPGLEIAGTAAPSRVRERPAALEWHPAPNRRGKPNIVFVAWASPSKTSSSGPARALPHASFLGVGISLSYAAGDVSRPPAWICHLGLEWSYRLCQEPTRRLARRYIVDGVPFAVRLMASAARHRARRGGPTNSGEWDD